MVHEHSTDSSHGISYSPYTLSMSREDSLRKRQERLQRKEAVAAERQAAVAAQGQTARVERDRETLQRAEHASTAAQRAEQECARRHDLFQARPADVADAA